MYVSNRHSTSLCFSALQRAEIAEIATCALGLALDAPVSVLFNEPKLLKYSEQVCGMIPLLRFSALQRAEIAEMVYTAYRANPAARGFSALQRAEIAEISTFG